MSTDIGLADIFVILLITIGPLKAAIVYAKLTGKADAAFKRQVAFKTVLVAAIVCLVFVFAGQWLLGVFHITLPALKIAGGLILLLFALDMVMGSEKKAEDGDALPSADIAVYPLAIPMMATPQGLVAITTVVATKDSIGELITVAVMVLVIMGINLATLLSADKLLKKGGGGAMVVVGKVVGLLLAALAVQLMISSFRDLGVIAAVTGAH
ncbi:MarC family protein [Labrys sp. La1]|uniref:MarC family protein n=1 Tax=Labrys sp. La1 TaxID=3404917 RepID=UPI003EBD1A0C